MGRLKCRVGEGPDTRGKDTDCPEGRDPITGAAIAEWVSKVTALRRSGSPQSFRGTSGCHRDRLDDRLWSGEGLPMSDRK